MEITNLLVGGTKFVCQGDNGIGAIELNFIDIDDREEGKKALKTFVDEIKKGNVRLALSD